MDFPKTRLTTYIRYFDVCYAGSALFSSDHLDERYACFGLKYNTCGIYLVKTELSPGYNLKRDKCDDISFISA
jgi:hypothetical protein